MNTRVHPWNSHQPLGLIASIINHYRFQDFMELIDITFWFSTIYIFPLWIMMWFFPSSEITKKIVGNVKICLFPLVLSYACLLLPNLGNVLVTLGTETPTPVIVIDLFSSDEMIILAWLHFLVMDTFAGRYVWMRMLRAQRPLQISAPVLITCMMLGPIGLILGIVLTSNVEDDISNPTRAVE